MWLVPGAGETWEQHYGGRGVIEECTALRKNREAGRYGVAKSEGDPSS